jgi:4-carboxymuconolactone decarboxylase
MRVVVFIMMTASLAAVLGAQTAALPKDIDPQSFSRLPPLTRDDMKDEGKTVGATGPAAISLYSPKVAESIQMLNQYLRFHGILKARDFEVAILVVAREFDQQYEWSGHEMGARAAKVPQTLIDAIKYNKSEVGVYSERDALLVKFASQLLHQHKLDSDVYARAVETFGKQGTLELATIIGDYAMAAMMLNATDQHLPPGREPLLPPK